MRTARDRLGAVLDQKCQRIRTDLVGRRCLKLSLIEFTVDWIEGSKNSETCALRARMSRSRFINKVSVNLPSQRYPPGLDSVVEIVVSRRTKFDVLICTATRGRKDLLHPFVELLGERCQVLGVVEFRIRQLLWLGPGRAIGLWVER